MQVVSYLSYCFWLRKKTLQRYEIIFVYVQKTGTFLNFFTPLLLRPQKTRILHGERSERGKAEGVKRWRAYSDAGRKISLLRLIHDFIAASMLSGLQGNYKDRILVSNKAWFLVSMLSVKQCCHKIVFL